MKRELRGLDWRGRFVYAAEKARERQRARWERVRFAVADERAGLSALAVVDRVEAWGEPEGKARMREWLGAA